VSQCQVVALVAGLVFVVAVGAGLAWCSRALLCVVVALVVVVVDQVRVLCRWQSRRIVLVAVVGAGGRVVWVQVVVVGVRGMAS